MAIVIVFVVLMLVMCAIITVTVVPDFNLRAKEFVQRMFTPQKNDALEEVAPDESEIGEDKHVSFPSDEEYTIRLERYRPNGRSTNDKWYWFRWTILDPEGNVVESSMEIDHSKGEAFNKAKSRAQVVLREHLDFPDSTEFTINTRGK